MRLPPAAPAAKPTFAWMLAAAAAGRLIVFLLLRQHWGWQPPYHLVYLQPPDFYDPAVHEYLVAHMPGYWAFLRIVRAVSSNLYVAAPVAQTMLQLLALARLTTTVGAVTHPRWPRAGLVLACALGLDPWLCETAIVMQPAALTGTLFILLVERTAAFAGRVIADRRLPAWKAAILTSAGLCAIGTYIRSDFATNVALLPAAVALIAWLIGAERPGRAALYAVTATAAALLIVLALLMPRALWLRAKSGALVMTTNSGGGALWYGLGEIENPWNIPNPETGDEAIEAFGRARGYPWSFASARTSAFFGRLFKEHIRERPSFLLKVFAARAHRATLGWAPMSVSFQREYFFWPEMTSLSDRMEAGVPRYQLLFTREFGPWIAKIYGLRYLGTAMIWLTALAAFWYIVRWREAHPLLLLPVLAYGVGVGVFLLVHWSFRYGQQYYWLGSLSAYLITSASARAGRY
jgi:hypothetical protein